MYTARKRILVDTDVFSYIFNAHAKAKLFAPFLSEKDLAVSFITLAQLYFGAYRKKWGKNKISLLEHYLKGYVMLEFNRALCLQWAIIKYDCEANGHPIETTDCWIAACALYHDCALATNNSRHFRHVKGLELISPE